MKKMNMEKEISFIIINVLLDAIRLKNNFQKVMDIVANLVRIRNFILIVIKFAYLNVRQNLWRKIKYVKNALIFHRKNI